jgi:pimeloyl-ACP methyl ester carboxylesterase
VMHRGIRHAKLRVIESSGHLANMETPEEFNQTLIECIESL